MDHAIYLFYFAKSYKTLWAIDILLREGCGEDAGSLLRTLFENLVNCLYIAHEPEMRSKLFAEYEYVLSYRYDILDELRHSVHDRLWVAGLSQHPSVEGCGQA